MDAAPTLDVLARPQAGIITRGQLLDAGWSPGRVDRSLASGRIVVVARGVYRVGGAPFTRRAAQHASLLAVGDGAVLARWTAAALHGFADHRPGPIDVLAHHPKREPRHCRELVRVKQTRSLPTQEQAEADGLPVTSGARTILDLAPAASSAQLAELVAGAVRVRACTLDELHRVLDRHPGARARARVGEALGLLADDGVSARSSAEIAALRALLRAGLPRPVVAFRVNDDLGDFLAEVDLAYPQHHIGIEIDGFRWHHTPERKQADEERQNRLVLAGWTILRFSAAEVRARPETLTAAVARALSARATD